MERREFFLPQSKYSFLPFLFLFAEDLTPLGNCHSVKTDIGFKEVLLPEPTGFLGPLWHRALRSKACLEERFQELEEMYPPWRLGTKKQERTLKETNNAYPCWCASRAQVKQDIGEQATPMHKASAESTPLGTQSQAPVVRKRQSPPLLSPAWLFCSLFSVYAWQSKGREKPCWAWGPMEPEEEDSLNSVFQPYQTQRPLLKAPRQWSQLPYVRTQSADRKGDQTYCPIVFSSLHIKQASLAHSTDIWNRKPFVIRNCLMCCGLLYILWVVLCVVDCPGYH